MIHYACDRCGANITGVAEIANVESTVTIKPESDRGYVLVIPAQQMKMFEFWFDKRHICARCTGDLAVWFRTPPRPKEDVRQ